MDLVDLDGAQSSGQAYDFDEHEDTAEWLRSAAFWGIVPIGFIAFYTAVMVAIAVASRLRSVERVGVI